MKYLFAVWPDKKLTPTERRVCLLEQVAPDILALPIQSLVMDIDDEHSTVKSPAPKWYAGDALVGLVSVEFDEGDTNVESHVSAVDARLKQAGFRTGVYHVDASTYKDYGDNEHFKVRDWPDGQRSPSVLAVTLLTRPKKFTHSEWIRRWHGKMSPVSERLQPRARYVRNVVLCCVGESTPPYDGIVEEAWPSDKHITAPYLFYCAKNPLQLVSHLTQMLWVITRFHQLHKIRTVTMSEYFLKTDWKGNQEVQ